MKPRHVHAIAGGKSRGHPAEPRPPRQRVWFMGPVSLFITMTAVFCVICLLYLWQDGEITTDNARIAALIQERTNAQQTFQTLSLQALTLQSQQRIQTEAVNHYHMQLVQDDQVQWIPVTVVNPALQAARAGASGASGSATVASMAPAGGSVARTKPASSPLGAWWESASHALAALFR